MFDPIGLVAPYTVRARLLVKDIWRLSGQQWDDPLQNELCRRFTEWESGLPVLGQLKIPRYYFSFPVDEVELHKFGDSSLNVFCSVAFLRAQKNAYSKCQLAFVFGKARVTPMKMSPEGWYRESSDTEYFQSVHVDWQHNSHSVVEHNKQTARVFSQSSIRDSGVNINWPMVRCFEWRQPR